ncbi:MAG: outer membrane beta-barrel protein [Nitrospirota bacterium]
MMRASIYALIVVLLGLPAAVWAQTPIELDFRIGPAIPLGDFSDFAGTGAHLGGTVLARVSPTVSVGLEMAGNVGHEKGPLETSIFQLTPVARVEAPVGGQGGFAYLLVGAGYYHTEYELFFLSDSFDDFGINVGAGVLIPLGSGVSAGFDLRYHHLFETGADPEYLVPGLLLTYTPGGP